MGGEIFLEQMQNDQFALGRSSPVRCPALHSQQLKQLTRLYRHHPPNGSHPLSPLSTPLPLRPPPTMNDEHKVAHAPSPTNDDYSHDAVHRTGSASVKEQLATWHADRGNKSFLRAMIPTWYNPASAEEQTTKNPFKLMAMVGPQGWLLFFSGWYVSPHPLRIGGQY